MVSRRSGSCSTRGPRTGCACASTRCTTTAPTTWGRTGLVKDGVEAHLQRLAEHITTLGDGWTLTRREFMTPIGPVDILCKDGAGATVAIEIKRRGTSTASSS